MNEVLLALIGLSATSVAALVWTLKTQSRQNAAREIAWREFMGNDQAHHREDMKGISQYMGEQTAVLREIREDLREMRSRGG